MCGIAGSYNVDAPVDQLFLARAAKLLAHRGPCHTGFHTSGTIGMVHTRLPIVDVDSGHQPFVRLDGKLALIANGEIYNYRELRAELIAKGHAFFSQSDCEVIINAYAEWGMDCLSRLRGMFAFALYDARSEKLFLVRDRLGIKPLYMRETHDGCDFASEITPLIAASESAAPNTDSLSQFLQHNFITGDQSIVQGIAKILPGQAVEIHRGKLVRKWTYWRLSDVEPLALTFDQAAERFDELMAEVISQHMRADVPFGVFLSGGIDSAIVLAMLRRFTDGPLRTYSVGFKDDSVANELASARRIAQLFETEHTELELDERELLKTLPQSIAVNGELMADYANLPTYLLSARASQDLRVVFSGEGGDEVFAGYGRYRARGLRRLLQLFTDYGTGGFRPPSLSRHYPARRLQSAAHYQATQRSFVEAWDTANPRWDRLQRMQATDIATWLTDDLLVKADRMAMAHGLEGRMPFLDHRIVEFGVALPKHLKVQGRVGKYFLRRWAERLLPKDHLWKRKQGFTVPIRQWLSGERMRKLFEVLASHDSTTSYLSVKSVRALLNRQLAHGDESAAVWALLHWGLWHEQFVAGTQGSLHRWVADA